MSGDLWQMARNGTTLLPSEVKKLAADYDRLRRVLGALKEPSDGVVWAVLERNYAVGPNVEQFRVEQQIYEVTCILRDAMKAAEKEAKKGTDR